MDVILYTTHCPLCKVLEQKLNMAGIEYTVSEDTEKVRELGYLSVPVLVVDGDDMNFKEACIWADEKAGSI